MVFTIRFWSLALSLVLAACADSRGSQIRAVIPSGDDLIFDLDLRFSETQMQALEHGIPLRLAVRPGGGARDVSIELRYSPLSRQYELILPGTAGTRVFRSRARLLAALDRVLIEDVAATRGEARVELVVGALPAPLRLPALIDREWWLSTPPYSWKR